MKPYSTKRSNPPPLQPHDRIVLEALVAAANGERVCPTADELADLMGGVSAATTVKAIQRLEAHQLIKVQRYQRGRLVEITASGACTAAPRNKTPHWRTRPPEMPLPALSVVLARHPSMADEVRSEAMRRNQPISDLLADLAWKGWLQMENERG